MFLFYFIIRDEFEFDDLKYCVTFRIKVNSIPTDFPFPFHPVAIITLKWEPIFSWVMIILSYENI